MWQQLFITLLSGLTVAGVYVILSTVIEARRAVADFKRKTGGLPMLEGANPLLSNHGVEFNMGSQVCAKLGAAHKRLGDTFGFLAGTRPCVSTVDLDLIKLFIHDEPQQHLNRLPINSAIQVLEQNSFFFSRDEQWRRIRRAFGPALRKYKIPNNVRQVELSVENLVASLDKKLALQMDKTPSISVNADSLMERYSMDVVFRCIYKRDNEISYDDELCAWQRDVERALGSIHHKLEVIPLKLCIAYPKLIGLFDWVVRTFTSLGNWQDRLFAFIRDTTKLAIKAREYLADKGITLDEDGHSQDVADFDGHNFRLADGTEFRRSITDFIIDHYLEGKLNRVEYMNSSFLLFGAAYKTVADAMVYVIYFLATDQRVQDKLRESIRAQGAESDYLSWVLNETIRLFPPAPIGCSRIVTRDIPLANGHLLPAGTYVHTNCYAIHRLEKYWGRDAHEFKPERWAEARSFHPCQFIGFGAGRRGCPGKEFAMFEMKALFTSLLMRYKFSCDKNPDIECFDSPYMLYVVPYARTHVKVTKIA